MRIGVLSPSVFLGQMYEADSELLVEKLSEQAKAIGLDLPGLLRGLFKHVPLFVGQLCEDRGIEIERAKNL